MFEELIIFMEKTFYGNTVLGWSKAALLIIAVFLVSKVLFWVVSAIFKKKAALTKSTLDDALVDMVEEPLIFAFVLGGLWFAIQTLTFSESVLAWIGKVFNILLVLDIAWLINRVFEAIYDQVISPLAKKSETDFDDNLLPVLRKGFKASVWIIAIVVGLNNAGYNVGALLAGLGIGGLAVAMAAKDSLSNIFGGFTIFTDKPFKLGDRVKVTGVDGFVREIGLRSTRIETLEGRIITVPNSKFTESTIENVSAEPNRKVVLNLGVTYDTTPVKIKKAMEILKKVADDHASTEEKVLISFTEFNDFALNILFIYYIKKGEDVLNTKTEVNLEILSLFNKEKIEFAFPTQTIITQKA